MLFKAIVDDARRTRHDARRTTDDGHWPMAIAHPELSFLYAIHRHDLFYITVKYHDFISKRFSSYGADTKLHLKRSRGNNSESMKVRVVILVRDTSSWPVLHNCEISWLYSKGYSSYRADTNMHKKQQRGDNSKSNIARALIFVRDTSPWPVLHNW